jgi:hypothetical protein
MCEETLGVEFDPTNGALRRGRGEAIVKIIDPGLNRGFA